MRPVCLLMIFSTLYTTLPHNLIEDKLIDLIERSFQREGSPYLACNDRNAFFNSEKPKKYHAWSCQNVCDALTFLLDNIFIRFGTKLYRQVVGIPMGTNCAPLGADLFLFCYERDFMMSLSDDKQDDVIDAFNTTSRYLDDILNINNVYFDNMVSQIYPSELQLNIANASDTEERKVAKIRNRYNQVPHLTQDTNGKVTNSQKTPQTRAKRSALSQQVTTKHI